MKHKLIIIALLIVAVAVGFLASDRAKETNASAPTGYQAHQASSSQITLTAYNEVQVFATSTCASRIISSAPTELMITLTDATSSSPNVPFRPSAGVGHKQAASTTVAYDSGIYGCDAWHIFNNSASTSIFTVTQFFGFK